MIKKNIHIFFSSAEKERIIEPIEKLKADKIFVFVFRRGEEIIDQNLEQTSENLRILKEKFPNIEIEKIGVTFTDYFLVIQEISKIVVTEMQSLENSEYQEIEIYINVSTGAKMSAIAAMDAIRIWPECNLSGYYAYSEDYDHSREIMHIGHQEMFRPPVMNFNKPSSELIKTMKLLEEISEKDYLDRKKGFVYNQELLEKLKENNLFEEVTSHSNKKTNESNELMRLKTRFTDPLEKQQYVQVDKKGRTKIIRLTEEGNKLVKIFKYLITIERKPGANSVEIIV